jgi:hypothetical protein
MIEGFIGNEKRNFNGLIHGKWRFWGRGWGKFSRGLMAAWLELSLMNSGGILG